MQVVDIIKEAFTNLLGQDRRDWWVEIVTKQPDCIYYFGPFHTSGSAKVAYSGYVEDLENEGSQVTNITIKRCEPKEFTICECDDEATSGIGHLT